MGFGGRRAVRDTGQPRKRTYGAYNRLSGAGRAAGTVGSAKSVRSDGFGRFQYGANRKGLFRRRQTSPNRRNPQELLI